MMTQIHCGEKPNKCNHCDYASSHAGNLRKQCSDLELTAETFFLPFAGRRGQESDDTKQNTLRQTMQMLNVNRVLTCFIHPFFFEDERMFVRIIRRASSGSLFGYLDIVIFRNLDILIQQ